MSANEANSSVQNSENETVTLIALPLHLFQQATQSNSLVVEQNLLFKTLPDGSLIIDTNQLANNTETISFITNSETNNPPNETKKSTEKQAEHKNNNHKNKPPPNNATKHNSSTEKKVKLKYINCKTPQDIVVRRPGRPRKIRPVGPFKCRHCQKEFDKWVLYRRHENGHSNDKKYKCSNCSASYNILSNYVLHVATHNTTDPTCPECGKKFQRVASLKAHLMYHEKEETINCRECDIKFKNDVEFNNHLTAAHQRKLASTSLRCKYCQFKFPTQSDYKKHMSEHNRMRSILHVPQRKKTKKVVNMERRHTCSVCNKSFQKRSQLERHMRVHSGEKPFVCMICDRGFSQKGTLQIHMTKHNGLRPHKCSLCPAKFSQKGNLRAHILKTHSVPRPGENVYSCTECSCVFKKLGSLNGHITRNHPETKGEDIKSMISQLVAMQNNMSVDKDILQQAILRSELSDVQNEEGKNNGSVSATYATFADLGLDGNMRRYIIKQRKAGDIRWHQCTFCCKEFRKPSDLVRHIRVHTHEKPYKCKLCVRSFAVKSTLTSHIQTHNGLKELKCKICSKIFTSISILNMHLKIHSEIKPHVCLICDKSFRTIPLLKQHSRQHASSEDSLGNKRIDDDITMQEPIIITNKGLQTVDVPLKKRPLTEAGSKHRPYCCLVCGACFRKLSHLKQHHVMHTGERPYKCHQCLRNFMSSGALKAHILTHNGAKPYNCAMCNKHFTTNGSLRRHLDSHSTTRPVICPYCYKNFKTVVTCRKHIKTHKGETAHESKESDFPPKINDLPYPPDLEDALANDTFNLTPIETDAPLTITETTEIPPVPPQNMTQTLQADETGTVVLPIIPSQENLTQENIREIEDTLNSQMLNIIGSENFVDSSVYTSKISNSIPATDELVNTLAGNPDPKMMDENQLLYQTVFVNLPMSEAMPTFDNNFDFNNLVLSQLKFQNDSLFLTDLSSVNINDSNVLLPFQLATQVEPQPTELMMMPAELDQNLQTNTTTDLDPLDSNLQLKLDAANMFMPVSDANIILSDEPAQTETDFLNTEENIEQNLQNITTNQNELITEPAKNENNETREDPLPLVPIVTLSEVPVINTYICNVCKVQFKTERSLKTHQCLNLVQVDNVTNATNTPEKPADNFVAQEPVAVPAVIASDDKPTVNIKSEEPSNVETQDSSQIGPTYKNLCSYCPKSFRKPSDLKRHIRTHTGERPFKCEECAKCFSLKSTLEGHQKIHQGRKDCFCPVCNALFATKSSLKIHMRLHTGARPFKCHLCNVKFRTSGHRKAHLLVHYKEAIKAGKNPEEVITRKSKMSTIINVAVQNIPQTAEKASEILNEDINLENFQESFEQFSTSDSLIIDANNSVLNFDIAQEDQNIINVSSTNMLTDESAQKENITQIHLDEKTRQEIEKLLNKNILDTNAQKKQKIPCEICKKQFNSKYFLERHMKSHSGERTYNCEICDKKFTQKNVLENHKRTHMGSRPYNCPYCSNTFSQRGNLKTHMKRIHANKINTREEPSVNNEQHEAFLSLIQEFST